MTSNYHMLPDIKVSSSILQRYLEMGWLKIGAREAAQQASCGDLKPSSQHLENVATDSNLQPRYSFAPKESPDADLQFISAKEISKRVSPETGGLLIVVDNIVYDCTDFLLEHPGGEQVIKSFGGAECSWQFWRFHGAKEMEEFGRQLRVGRTEDLRNKFPEPKKYIGLRTLTQDEWE